MSRIRAFLAINFPVAVVRRIADEVSSIKQRVADTGCRVAWVPAANIHLTLKFLGMIEAPSAEAIVGRLGRELAGRTPFDLEARALGAFPSPEHPRVLWVGVQAPAALAALQQDVEGWMADLGYAREEKAFHPHLTIGRVKEPGTVPAAEWLPALLQERAATTFGVGRATEVVLYESRTLGSASEYHALGRAALGRR